MSPTREARELRDLEIKFAVAEALHDMGRGDDFVIRVRLGRVYMVPAAMAPTEPTASDLHTAQTAEGGLAPF